jgi:acyl-coenzyme A synthetase/AMP-(fatty) acid ligase
MRRSLIGKRGRDGPSPFANVEVHLLEPRLESKHHALTNVDPVGVIEHFTFADVAREAGRWAHLLRMNGLQPGDRVLVVAGREWAWRCALLGVLRAGGVAVPCQASMPLEEIRAIAASAGAQHLISIPARPDLAETEGLTVLDANGVHAIDASRALREPAHQSLADDVALVLYARHADGLCGAMHTHASLIAQADAGKHWLGVGEDEPVWCTAAEGSPESIWLLLAGWQEGAPIVNVDLELDPEATLELLGRLGTAAVWFSDEEYERLESAGPAAWINGSINRALLSDERSSGAAAFANAVGANVAAVFGVAELGVVAGWPPGTEERDTAVTAQPVPGIELGVVGEQGTRLAAGLVGDLVVRGEAPSLVAGYAGSAHGIPQRDGWFRFGWRGALTADGALRLASRSPAELEPVDADAEAERRRRREEEEARKLVAAAVAAAAAEAESARREAAAAEERRRAEERLREHERRLAEQEAARRAEQEAREREQAEAAARAEREAKERRRTEEEQWREEERRRQDEDARRRVQQAKEREQAEAAAMAEREAAVAAEGRRADAAEKERGSDTDGGGQVGDAALLGRAASEISVSSAGAVAVPEQTYSAASIETDGGVIQAKPGKAKPAWRRPGVWAWIGAAAAGARTTRRWVTPTARRSAALATAATSRARHKLGRSAAYLIDVVAPGSAAAGLAGARATRRRAALTAQRSRPIATATAARARTGTGVPAARLEILALRGAAAARAARRTRRWAALTAQRSAALAATTTLSARRQRSELLWYVTTGLLAVGIGVVLAVWLNGG